MFLCFNYCLVTNTNNRVRLCKNECYSEVSIIVHVLLKCTRTPKMVNRNATFMSINKINY